MEHFTDDELAFLRHVRFGEIPARVKPEDYVELQETEPAHELDVPETLADIQFRGQAG